MRKLLKDNDGYYYQTDKRNYRIYTIVRDDKVVIFADHEHNGGIEERFVNWSYMDGFENRPESYKNDIEIMVNEYERKEII